MMSNLVVSKIVNVSIMTITNTMTMESVLTILCVVTMMSVMSVVSVITVIVLHNGSPTVSGSISIH